MFKVREYVKNKCARVVHIDTTQNCADMFTKPLPAVQFKAFRALFMRLVVPERTSKTSDVKPIASVVTPFSAEPAGIT